MDWDVPFLYLAGIDSDLFLPGEVLAGKMAVE